MSHGKQQATGNTCREHFWMRFVENISGLNRYGLLVHTGSGRLGAVKGQSTDSSSRHLTTGQFGGYHTRTSPLCQHATVIMEYHWWCKKKKTIRFSSGVQLLLCRVVKHLGGCRVTSLTFNNVYCIYVVCVCRYTAAEYSKDLGTSQTFRGVSSDIPHIYSCYWNVNLLTGLNTPREFNIV